MQWWEETVHMLVAMDDWKQEKQLEPTIRELVQAVVEQGRLKAGSGRREAKGEQLKRHPFAPFRALPYSQQAASNRRQAKP
jgi:hypothetical protein